MSPVHLRNLGIPRNQPGEQDTLDTVVNGKKLREIISTLPFTFKFNRNLKQEEWKDMDQVLQLHQLPKDLLQWSMDKRRFNLASHWAELGASFERICLKELPFKNIVVITNDKIPTGSSNCWRRGKPG
ncbi:hypothetical protein O181_008400 [Austropuccinia psidii MF-1]|uniref:Uncharacterized protein n=1 Tax=Austropuccinia psidii MF-1 TaxID=1389203 RepID=A0A9Q3GIV0_9BASI|nr:hypothetical protein [Austropuccinia psidii MF-1]